MGSLKQKIEDNLKEALKAKQMPRVSTIRLILSSVKNKEIELRGLGKIKLGDALDDDGLLKLLSTLAKQRQESMDMFAKGGRQDLVDKEKAELDIIMSYLPSQLSSSEVEKVIDEVVKELGASGMKDVGPVMKTVMVKLSGKADGKLVSDLVRKKLS